jgi:DNA-binding PadR family transcriptional regulator
MKYELTGFQRDLLYVIAGIGPSSGQEIKHELESDFDFDINHGRLYPNLDTLINNSLVSKEPRDRRTNDYGLTEEGRQYIRTRRSWENKYVDTVVELTQ